MTQDKSTLDLYIEDAEAFDAPSDAGDFVAGVACGALVAAGVALIAVGIAT